MKQIRNERSYLPVRNNENIWTNEQDGFFVSYRLHEEFPEVQNGTEWSVFQLVFGDIIDLLVQKANLYTSDKMDTKFKVFKDEIKNFIGLLLLTGYNYCSNANDYWSTAPDLSMLVFAETMSKQRFRDIKRYLHVCDNILVQRKWLELYRSMMC